MQNLAGKDCLSLRLCGDNVEHEPPELIIFGDEVYFYVIVSTVALVRRANL